MANMQDYSVYDAMCSKVIASGSNVASHLYQRLSADLAAKKRCK